jgi:hypothetical protein
MMSAFRGAGRHAAPGFRKENVMMSQDDVIAAGNGGAVCARVRGLVVYHI